MKERELRNASTCVMCSRKIGETGIPLFWRVTVESYAINLEAVKRQQGLAMLFGGNGALALAMGPDEDMAKHIAEPATVTLCAHCAVGPIALSEIAEKHRT